MRTQQPTVSIVIPCYNYADYVGNAIESALAQDYAAARLVVVNDGSTDDSLKVIQRYADRLLLVDQPNQGMVAAWHAGVAAAASDIVIFLDADDLLEPDVASCVASVWTPQCAKIQYDLKIIDGSGADLGRLYCGFTPDYDVTRVRDSFARTGTYRWPVTVGNAYSRWFLDLAFPLQTTFAPDGALNSIAPVYGDVVTIPRALASYRVHGSNSWAPTSSDWGRLPDRICRRQWEVDFLRDHAQRRGVALPPGNVLDHELVFINYRLLAWRLGLDYVNKSNDSPLSLLRHAASVIRAERCPPRAALAHAAWFGALFASPRWLARELFRLRFSQSKWRNAVQRLAQPIADRGSQRSAA
ncbi:MAG: glycosyltransferase family A protein [Polyangiaceae bacterium]